MDKKIIEFQNSALFLKLSLPHLPKLSQNAGCADLLLRLGKAKTPFPLSQEICFSFLNSSGSWNSIKVNHKNCEWMNVAEAPEEIGRAADGRLKEWEREGGKHAGAAIFWQKKGKEWRDGWMTYVTWVTVSGNECWVNTEWIKRLGVGWGGSLPSCYAIDLFNVIPSTSVTYVHNTKIQQLAIPVRLTVQVWGGEWFWMPNT